MSVLMGRNVYYAPDAVAEQMGVGNGNAPEKEQSGVANTSPAWMSQLSSDLKNDPELAKHSTLSAAIRELRAMKKEGSKGNKETVTETEDLAKQAVTYENFSKKLSEESDPYGTLNDFFLNKLQGFGINQKDAEIFFDDYAKLEEDFRTKYFSEGQELIKKQAQKTWGKDYDANLRYVQKGYSLLDDKDGTLQKRLDNCGISLAMPFWDVMCRVGKLVSEDSPVSSNQSSSVEPRRGGFCPIDYSKPSK